MSESFSNAFNKKQHRLYIVTGKGGVGKSIISMALTLNLKERGIDAHYHPFHQDFDSKLWEKLKLPVFDTDVNKSAEVYIGKKLNSKTIASWVMKTQFFKSLFQMLPSLGHMIVLGHLLNELEENPNKVIIMDSPASGHALTMFESSSNFKQIFRSGLIVKDIEKMHHLLSLEHFLKVIVVTLPTELAVAEANDLALSLKKIEALTSLPQLIVNDSYDLYLKNSKVDCENIPDFLKTKIEHEERMIGNLPCLPHVPALDTHEVISKLISSMDALI